MSFAATIEVGSASVISRTDGTLASYCGNASISGGTNLFTGWSVSGSLSLLSFETCERPVTVHWPGQFKIEHIVGTTDGTVSLSEAAFTVGSPFGTLSCKTGASADIGTLTGVDGFPSLLAEVDVNAVLNCGFLVPSAKWNATYTVTSPWELGVSA